MAKVKPEAVNANLYAHQAVSAIRHLNYPKIGQAGEKLILTAARLEKIRAPAGLTEPHSSLVRGVRIQGRALTREVADHKAGVDPIRAANKAIAAFDTAQTLLEHWREEVVTECRQAGISVPLWVKRVGT